MTHEERVQARKPSLKAAQTVLGPVAQDQLGVVLPQECILADFRRLHDPFYPDLSERPVELSTWGRLRRHPTTCLDNLLLDDERLAEAELARFAHVSGVGTIVDLSGAACLRPEALPRLAQATGLHIVVGTGPGRPAFHSADLQERPLEALAERFARDVTEGLEGVGYRAGAIGLIGLSDLSDPAQAKLLRAAARAASETAAPLVLELPVGAFGSVHRLLGEESAAPSQVWLAAMDHFGPDEEREAAAKRGYYLLFDGFGKEWYWRGWESRTPRDFERLAWLKALVDAGHLRQLLLSQGIDRKNLLTRYGGYGYAHLLENVVPWMERERFAPKEITTLLKHNPARALAYLTPPSPSPYRGGKRRASAPSVGEVLMRAIVWRGPRNVAIEERPVPAPRPGQVLIEVLTNGVCSTDYPIAKGLVAGSKPGMVLGHEPVGIVVDLGEGVAREWLGRRVALDTILACGECRFCREGHGELCASSDEIGFSVDGNWSDFASLPVANLRPLPESIGDVEGTMLEALTCQLGAMQALNVGFGDSVAIVGSGLAALLFVRLARLRGAGHVAIAMRPFAERWTLAEEAGADVVADVGEPEGEHGGEREGGYEGEDIAPKRGEALARGRTQGSPLRQSARVRRDDGFDVAIDAVGTGEAARLALSLTRRGGKVLLYGLRSPVMDGFPLAEVIFRNLTLYGRTSAPRMWEPAIDLVGRGAIRLGALGAEEIHLEQLPEILTGPHRHSGPLKHVVRIKED